MASELFQRVDFVMHAGGTGRWKIECDALSYAEIETLALMLNEMLPEPFYAVYGVPSGGMRLAAAMDKYATRHQRPRRGLIVDDVLTTGQSMEECRAEFLREPAALSTIGAVLFARGPCPDWITPLFQMPIGRAGR